MPVARSCTTSSVAATPRPRPRSGRRAAARRRGATATGTAAAPRHRRSDRHARCPARRRRTGSRTRPTTAIQRAVDGDRIRRRRVGAARRVAARAACGPRPASTRAERAAERPRACRSCRCESPSSMRDRAGVHDRGDVRRRADSDHGVAEEVALGLARVRVGQPVQRPRLRARRAEHDPHALVALLAPDGLRSRDLRPDRGRAVRDGRRRRPAPAAAAASSAMTSARLTRRRRPRCARRPAPTTSRMIRVSSKSFGV